MMTARLQCHIRCGAARPVTGLRQCIGFRMWLTGFAMPALAHDFTIAHQHTADARIGISGVQAQLRELQRPSHQ